MTWLNVKSPIVFYLVAGALLSYLVYMMIRRRKGERPGFEEHEAEL